MSDLPLIVDSPHVLWERAVADIPQEIHEAAETVSRYFRNEGMDEWTFGPIASRSYLERVEVESSEWCNKALQYAAEREHNAMEALAYKAERDALLGALEAMACQHKCGCGHPHCNRCADDSMCSEVIAMVKGGTR